MAGANSPGLEIHKLMNEGGYIEDYNRFEETLSNAIERLFQMKINESPIVFTEPNKRNKENRLKLTEVMFETAQIPAMYIHKSAPLSAFSAAKSTAVILDSGVNQTSIVSVHEGYVMEKAMLVSNLGGKMMDDVLKGYLREQRGEEIIPQFLTEKNFPEQKLQIFEQSTGIVSSKTMKPLLTKVYQGVEEETPMQLSKKRTDGLTDSLINHHLQKDLTNLKSQIFTVSHNALSMAEDSLNAQEYELPDGTSISIGDDKYKFAEAFFTGNFDFQFKEAANANEDLTQFTGLADAINSSISNTDIDIRKQELYQNILVTGGPLTIPGLVQRLQTSLNDTMPHNIQKVRVSQTNASSLGLESCHSAWIGGSILASMKAFQQRLFTKQEYEENGAIMIERKCP